MKIFINHRSGVPIYKQVVQQVERGITGGILQPGDRLPTVREVALDLTVNPNTVARAYRELEAQGMIRTVQGSGTFVSSDVGEQLQKKEKWIEDMLVQLCKEAQQVEISPADMEKIFFKILRKWKEGGLNGE